MNKYIMLIAFMIPLIAVSLYIVHLIEEYVLLKTRENKKLLDNIKRLDDEKNYK